MDPDAIQAVVLAGSIGCVSSGDSSGYCSPPGRHRHECVMCKLVWEHETILINKVPYGTHDAHTCPECGHVSFQPWEAYSGPKSPAYHDPGSSFVRKVNPEDGSLAPVVLPRLRAPCPKCCNADGSLIDEWKGLPNEDDEAEAELFGGWMRFMETHMKRQRTKCDLCQGLRTLLVTDLEK